jgi:Carboxypeptidase regulatory-like domain
MRRTLLLLLVLGLLAGLGLWSLQRHVKVGAVPDRDASAAEPRTEERLTGPESQPPRAPEAAQAALPKAEAPRGSVSGRFVDEHDKPVAEVEVLQLKRPGETQKLATSGPDGRFRFEVTGFTAWGKLGLNLRGAKRPYVPARFDVIALQEQNVDAGDLVLRQGGLVSGRVVDASGLGVAEARVSCTKAGFIDRDRATRIGPGLVVSETQSGSGGEFVLDGAPPGEVRMWASKQGMRHAFVEGLTVSAGEETSGVVLVLVPRTASDDFTLQVLEPGGAPCAGAEIDYSYACPLAGSGSGNRTADAQGCLTLSVWDSCPYRFSAVDPGWKFGPACVPDVLPGSGPVVLQLTARVPLRVHVVDEEGAAVEKFDLELRDPQSTLRAIAPRAEEDAHPGGMLELSAPAVPFLLVVKSEGFEPAQFGPYQPGSSPAELEVRLARLPGLSGRVLAAGQPVEGAKVQLFKAVPPIVAASSHEFATRYSDYSKAEGSSAANGRFHLSLKEPGRYFVRAEKPAWAAAELGPLDIDPRTHPDPVELVLTPGGSIEGRVLLPPDESPTGTVVGISRGDSMPRTLRVGVDGAFRFEQLTPGRWYVKRCANELPKFGSAYGVRTTERPVEIPWNCEVAEGGTTHFDLDLRVDRRATLVGSLQVAGKPAVGWRVVLLSAGDQMPASEFAETDATGAFHLWVLETGHYDFNARGSFGAPGEVKLTDRVDLQLGEQTWSRDLPGLGQVAGRRASATPAGQSEPFLVWFGPGDLRATMGFLIDAQGHFDLPLVPSGSCRIEAWIPSGKIELVRFDVRAGETTQVELP